jgi:hypothetical protein
LLKYFSNAESGKYGKEERPLFMEIPEARFKFVLRRPVHLCHRMGHAADVRWTIDFFQRVQVERRRPMEQGSREARGMELSNDIDTDANGRLVYYDLQETFEDAHAQGKKLASKVGSPFEQSPASAGTATHAS